MTGTVVYLRSRRPPVTHWEAVVHYDAWGTPYTKPPTFNFNEQNFTHKVLLPNGKTDDTLYEVEWKHKSGPEITWPTSIPEPWGRR